MPKVRDYIPMSLLLDELDQLDGLVQITPNQVSILLGISKNKLSDRQGNGKSPPFVKEGGQYRYRVGDIRNFMNGIPSIHPPRLPIEYKSYYPSGTRWLGGTHLIPWLNDN